MLTSEDTYRTDPARDRSLFDRAFLRWRCTFYPQILTVIVRASWMATRGRYSRTEWIRSSEAIVRCLENVGMTFTVEGMNHIRHLSGPAVFVSNHMSTLETFVLPGIIEPIRTCTFIVKEELLTYPVFGSVMRFVDPIAVTRTNPKEDLIRVLDEGTRKLQEGFSVIVFPQTTRMPDFRPENFNTLGVKLAIRGNVPMVPVALKTDAWGNGKRFKDFGKIDPDKNVHFAFGEPILSTGRGLTEHAQVIDFIISHLTRWNRETIDQ